MNLHHHNNPQYIHHKKAGLIDDIRELVFGLEDGMVSTLGAITGIAAATRDPFTILLAGFVVISVESISMAVGSYLSSKSKRAVEERKLFEEETELKRYPKEEKEELIGMYVADGWSKALAEQMATEASQNHELFLKEMAYRELKVFPDDMDKPVRNGVIMGVSYIVGGSVPLLPYLFLPFASAIWLSIIATLLSLFLLGAFVTRYSKRSWLRSGIEMLSLAGIAALVGFFVGQIIEGWYR